MAKSLIFRDFAFLLNERTDNLFLSSSRLERNSNLRQAGKVTYTEVVKCSVCYILATNEYETWNLWGG
jgi:hypothetical protein